MTYPKTAEEWWQSVNDHWENLLDILSRFLPMNGMEIIDEESCKVKLTDRPMYRHILKLKEERNSHLARYFNAAWGAAPDNPSIHQIPSWDALCDLCSEEWVLAESEDSHDA